ncbi:MAG: HAD family hydrolase [Nanoarchaeota archaeon]|nr:HAD family hydrolase [Nanoarchaeota archaeon]MBU4352708.1 HAD family hydrolase [Nanoarchaeota archaeon]MBU4456116.1 HAD family hydrolase [Nanoarchaeota archaeon]MCG2720148.1 HAD family hydrolase [Nanoarchaeota archaeon]
MIKAVIFDFWGTLADNGIRSPLRQTYNMLGLYRFTFPEFVQKFEHIFMTKKFDTLDEAFRKICQSFNINCREDLLDRWIGMWNKNWMLAKLYEDTLEGLQKLKEQGLKIGLISNTDNFSIEKVLDKFELKDKFDAIVLSFDCGFVKNNPEMFDLICEKLDVAKDEVLMVGDSPETDIKGAENAGIKAVLIDRHDRRPIEHKIISLADIENFLNKQ